MCVLPFKKQTPTELIDEDIGYFDMEIDNMQEV
jgi:hypothetical protein